MTWGFQSLSHPSEDDAWPFALHARHARAVAPVAESGWGAGVDGGGRVVVVAARWAMGCGYV